MLTYQAGVLALPPGALPSAAPPGRFAPRGTEKGIESSAGHDCEAEPFHATRERRYAQAKVSMALW